MSGSETSAFAFGRDALRRDGPLVLGGLADGAGDAVRQSAEAAPAPRDRVRQALPLHP